MANILYYTRTDFLNRNRNAGGMGTKTISMQEAWDMHDVTVADRLPTAAAEVPIEKTWLPPQERSQQDANTIKQYDLIMIELMGLLNPRERFEERVSELEAYPAPKIVYGSDSEIFRWTGNELNRLKTIVTAWIANCEWQADYFRDFDLPVLGVLYEPINTDLFRPSENTEKIIVAGGTISYAKQTEFFIRLFEELKQYKKQYKTAYVGSAGGWGDFNPPDLRLQHELKKHTELFYGQVPQAKVASTIGKAAVGVLNPKYETCNRFGMELLSSGKPRVCGKHRCYDEQPTTARFVDIKECIDALAELTADFTQLPDKELGVKARKYAEEHFSYKATQEQLNNFIRSIL